MKNILIMPFLLIVIFLTIGFIAYRHITRIPDKFTPGIYAGEGFLQKNLFAEDARVDVVTDIAFGQLDPNDGLEYCIAGNLGAIFRNEDGKQFGYVKFKNNKYPLHEYEIVTDGKSGNCSFRTDGFPPKKKARSGEIPKKIDKMYPFGDIVITPFPTEKDPLHFLIYQNEDAKYAVLDKDGVRKAELDLPYLNNFKAFYVRFKSDEPSNFVVVGKMAFQGTIVGYSAVRAVLFVFDSNQKLVYHEVLEDDVSILRAAALSVPSGNKDESTLLVGGNGRVWEYNIITQ